MGTRQNTVIFGVKATITNRSANNETLPNTTSGYTYRRKTPTVDPQGVCHFPLQAGRCTGVRFRVQQRRVKTNDKRD